MLKKPIRTCVRNKCVWYGHAELCVYSRICHNKVTWRKNQYIHTKKVCHKPPSYYNVSVLQPVSTKLLSVKNIQTAQAPGVYKNILCLASTRIYNEHSQHIRTRRIMLFSDRNCRVYIESYVNKTLKILSKYQRPYKHPRPLVCMQYYIRVSHARTLS